MNIYIETATNVEISLIYVAPGTSYSTATIEPLKAGAGNIKQITQIKLGQSWWIMYEPTKLRAAELTIMTWVSKDFNAAAQKADEARAAALIVELERLAALEKEQKELIEKQKEEEAIAQNDKELKESI